MSYEKNVALYLSNLASNEASRNTLESYERTLVRFGAFMQKNGFAEPTIDAVAAFKASLSESGLKITSLALYMTHIHAFFTWAAECRLYAENPCVAALMPPRKKVAEINKRGYDREKIVDREELCKILTADRPKGAYANKWPQTKAILVLFLLSGMRNTELCDLTPADLDPEEDAIHILHGKGDKERTCSYPPAAQNAVAEYLASGIRPAELTDSDPLFVIADDKGVRPYERVMMSRLVERNIAAVTGRKNVRSHALRHSFASLAADNGMNIHDLQGLLGHSSITTTERYIERLNPNSAAKRMSDVFSKMLAS